MWRSSRTRCGHHDLRRVFARARATVRTCFWKQCFVYLIIVWCKHSRGSTEGRPQRPRQPYDSINQFHRRMCVSSLSVLLSLPRARKLEMLDIETPSRGSRACPLDEERCARLAGSPLVKMRSFGRQGTAVTLDDIREVSLGFKRPMHCSRVMDYRTDNNKKPSAVMSARSGACCSI
jgi:hypothetical protein